MKRWVISFVAAGLLIVGVAGGVVLANDEGEGSGTTRQGFISRVAAILGLEEQQVRDAFQQAAREMQDEHMAEQLARLVEAGRITQEEADQFLAWFQARPADLLLPGPFHHHHVKHAALTALIRGRIPVEMLEQRLSRLVEAEQITQEQADAIIAWYEARPVIPALDAPGPEVKRPRPVPGAFHQRNGMGIPRASETPLPDAAGLQL